jgi:hypothetical protein
MLGGGLKKEAVDGKCFTPFKKRKPFYEEHGVALWLIIMKKIYEKSLMLKQMEISMSPAFLVSRKLCLKYLACTSFLDMKCLSWTSSLVSVESF